MFQEFNRGYDTKAHGALKEIRPNGRIYNTLGADTFVSLWVIDVTIPFGLDGRSAQSRTTRDFYVHNSIPPIITVQCIAPNQSIYGQTMEMIRDSQKDLDTAYLSINGGGIAQSGRTLKGLHKPVSAEGYIQNARRKHSKFEYAPEFAIGFVVAKMHDPFADTQVSPRQLMSWHDVVQKVLANDQHTGFAEDPDARPVPDRPPLTPGPNGELRPN